ncbi:hypothetical protein MHU86_200 [Fragilaria crotonensis]|nr:hypothetical protein MHU86_200 [Fragilaria crotonensis]
MSSCDGVPARSSSECAFAAAASNNGGESDVVNDRAGEQFGDDGDETIGTTDIPLLPASDPNSDIPSIRLGETIQFEEMGPIIINLDGTTRRIDNWNEMTKQEQAVSWRRIAKRNEERRKILMEKMRQEEELGDDSQT